ncbi:glycosyltransferase family 39 protein [uncultured Paludibaculum sp.]|uniref:ArnT family glycosyltransferase n=1 Tax=uncultured Paludibaculum sp. TaxID=1765020 RepID=UPI002AAC11F9|nr:glycosyltransferase family 39 protein [uncultured Paludibaculum sp.]
MSQATVSSGHQRFLWMLAILWGATLLPYLSPHYSFGWDSSQFDRAVTDFDIARHQPHPPGYPLWVVALRGLAPILGNPNTAQVVVALLFTLAGLWFFRALARDLLGERAAWPATLLVAFSPLICLYASSSQVYAVDFFVSCFAGWVTRELGLGRTQRAVPSLAVVALAAGFRPSGVVFLFPLLGIGLWQCCRKQPGRAVMGILAGAACWLAWLTPTALLSGGFGALAALNHDQVQRSFSKTSVLYSAPAIVHLHMAIDVCVYFAVAIAGFLPALAAALWPRDRRVVDEPARSGPSWATPTFFALWMAPNLALIYLFHCSQPGYLLLSLPPLFLLLAWLARHTIGDLRLAAAGIAVALLVGHFPYERFMDPAQTTLPFVVLRATPRISGLVEASQREIRSLIDAMPGRPEEKLVFCLLRRFEAPNIRTVTYDFPDVAWADLGGPGLRVFLPGQDVPLSRPSASVRSVGLVCDGAGLPATVRAQFPGAQRVAGNQLFSFWTVAWSADSRN